MFSGSTIPAPDAGGKQPGPAGIPHATPASPSDLSTIQVGGTDVTYRLTGAGEVVVFITQGLGLASAEWWPIQDRLSGQARVLTWDRPGYGDSGSPRSSRSVANVAGEALELLNTVAPETPLVLVGHSQGGLYTNALARLAGGRVRGVALLDPAHAANSRLRRELPPRLFQRSGSDLAVRLRMARTLARLHLMGVLKPVITKGPPFTYCRHHPPEARRRMWRQLTHPAAYEAALQEYAELEDRTDSADLEAMGTFPPVPLALLMHDPESMIGQFVKLARLSQADAERVEGLWGELLRDHAALSPLTRAETLPGCGHLIHLEAPNETMATIAGLVGEQPQG